MHRLRIHESWTEKPPPHSEQGKFLEGGSIYFMQFPASLVHQAEKPPLTDAASEKVRHVFP